MRASLSQETIQSIFELSQQGWSARQIAQELSVSLGVVSKYLNVNTPPARNKLNVNTPQIQNEHQNEHPNPLLTAAIEYAAAGWRVIPLHAMVDGQCSCGKDCGSPAKHPVTYRGLKDATTDTSLVKSWWQRYPWANVGVVTGEASGIIVLDVDSYKGGMESLSGLWLGQPTENIPQALTGGGGRHLFFRHPSAGRKVGNRCEFMPGLDIRGDGGYIVAPPSNHASGRSYEWNSFSMPSREELADPKALLTILDSVDKEKAAGHSQTSQYSDTPGTVRHPDRYAEAAIERACRAISSASQGQRNATLNEQAFPLYRLAAGGIADMGQVEAALKASAMATGLPVPEIKATLRSARRAAEADPKRLKVEENEQWRANGRQRQERQERSDNAEDMVPQDVESLPPAPPMDDVPPPPEPEQQGPELPEIIVSNRQLREIVKESWNVVMANNTPPKFFYHGGSFSALEMSKDASRPEDNILIIQHLSKTQMHGLLLRLANWMEFNKKGNKINARPPKEIAPDMVEIVSDELPVLDGLIHAPVFNYDGVVVDRTGYDPASRLYLAMPESLEIPNTPYDPTPDQLAAAKDLILEIFHDFPFEDQADKANAIALLLLPFCRRMIRGCTPLHLITAPSPRTGKSLLSEVVSSTLTGAVMQGLTLPSQDDEVQKTLLSKLMEARPIILIDNIDQNKTLNSPSLAAYLTMPMPEGRLLGSSTMIRAQNNAVWIATGNNPKLSTEIAGRCVRIRIDSKTDRPEKRTGFLHHPLIPWVKANRGRIISACLTVIHAWVRAGQPRYNSLRLGGFDDWVAIMGGILQVAGIEGFMTNSDKLFDEADAEGAMWREFVAAWREEFEDRWCSSRDLASLCRDRGLMGGVMGDGSEKSQDTRMGGALRRIAARVYDGYQIVSSKNSKTKREQYRLIQIDGQTDKVAPGETRGLL